MVYVPAVVHVVAPSNAIDCSTNLSTSTTTPIIDTIYTYPGTTKATTASNSFGSIFGVDL